jgi:lysophospholipase L1-like esterase
MKIALYGDSLTEGRAGVAYVPYLQQHLPEHDFLNYGKGGDTAISLYNRLVRDNLARPVDVSFLFVGVNDILVHVKPQFGWIKLLAQQPWAKTVDIFANHYQKILDLLTPNSAFVFAVSSLFIGEDVTNAWNQQLTALNNTIVQVAGGYNNVEYLDVRSEFIAALDASWISPYVLNSATQVVIDTLFLRENEQVDRKSAARGLQLTIDGVHLNSHGAKLVAQNFTQAIKTITLAEETR